MEMTQFIDKAIQIAVHEVLGTMFKVQAKSVDDSLEFVLDYPLIFSLGLVGQLEGNLLIAFSKEHACQIVSKMIGMEITEFNEEAADGACEFLNVVAGNVQRRMAELDFSFDIGIPMIFRSKEFELLKGTDTNVIRNHYDCDDFDFELVMVFKVYEEGQAPEKKALADSLIDAEKALQDIIKKNSEQ